MEYGLADMNKKSVTGIARYRTKADGTLYVNEWYIQRMTIIIGITTEKVERHIRGFEQYTENHTTLMNMMEVCIEI